jgi:signal transduction histidine kinase
VSLGLAEQMQGTIRVTGEYGVGSTFRLILPATRPPGTDRTQP